MISEQPAPSPFGLKNRLARIIWAFVYLGAFRWTPRPAHAWRAMLLRGFGAKLGRAVHVYPMAKIWAPWNLEIGDRSGIGDGVILYTQGKITIGRDCVISQGAHLCTGTHDYHDPAFPLITKPIVVQDHVWVAAEAFIHPDVTLAEGCVIGARSVVTKDTEAWTVYSGFPAKKIGMRQHA